MNRLVGSFAPGNRPGSERLERVVGRGGPTERLAGGDYALAWRPSDEIAAWRSDGVVCVVAGRPQRRGGAGEHELAPVLGRAYVEAGAECLDGLTGAFAVFIWDRPRRRGLLATDRLGIAAVVFRQTSTALLFALELADLLPLFDRRPAPDEAAVAQWLDDGTTAREATLYAGVERLAGGQLFELDLAGATRRRYWQPVYVRPDAISRAEAKDRLRAEVCTAVGRHVSDAEGQGVLLSGGLDSGVVAATAASLSTNLRSYSLVFPDHRAIDEADVIERVAEELDLPSRRLAFSGGGIVAASFDYVREWGTPPASPTLAVHRPLLEIAAADGVTTLLDGQGGDELFGASFPLLADLVRSGRLLRAYELAHRIDGIPDAVRGRAARRALWLHGFKGAAPRSMSALLGSSRHDRAERAPWLAARPARRDAETPGWHELAGPRWWSQLADELTAFRERSGAHQYLRHRNALAGVRGVHPFLQDLDLIETVLGLPPEFAFDPDFDRPLLRGAMEGVVPDRVRLRTGKSYFTPIFIEAVAVHDAATITALVTAPDAEIRAYTRPEVVRARLVDAPAARRGGAWAFALWRLATLEWWLRGER